MGFKPLMYFCFDHLSNQQDTVALTCPRLGEYEVLDIKILIILDLLDFPQGTPKEQSAQVLSVRHGDRHKLPEVR